MKKPLTIPDEPQPRNITRADLVMTEGFGLEVDGRMKTVFPTLEAAQKRARALKAEFPMLQIKVYDAAKKKRSRWNCRPLNDARCDGHSVQAMSRR
jgi:hypothetical protein